MPLSALYLFAWVDQRAEIATVLEELCRALRELEETTIELTIVEVDTQRGGKQNVWKSRVVVPSLALRRRGELVGPAR